MLRNIHFHGALKALNPKPLRLDVNSTGELISALTVLVPGFEKKLYELQNFHVVLTDKTGEKVTELSEETVSLNWSPKNTEVHLAPQIDGGGVEIALFILGSAAAGTVAATVLGFAINLAISFAIGAVVQALAPTPKGGAVREAADSTPSFLFNGAQNVQEQGYLLPLIFGIHMTGSIVASASTSTDELPIPVTQKPEPAAGGTTTPAPPDYVYYEPTGGA